MNSGDTYREEERLFGEAVVLSDEERATYLAQACGDRPALRHQVEALLREHGKTGHAIDLLPGRELRGNVAGAEGLPAKDMSLASRAARFVLGSKLGEGGWGVVYSAEQLFPVRRNVAIKVLKLGMDTRAIVLRFQAEQQALALMDHENIARVFDAGETEQGRPFFVMEEVGGVRITHFCDEHRLSIPERLELFMQVCGAVQHAHQKRVIHRDLKPSNILVTEVGGKRQPKIIDFGVAKATFGRLTDETVVTEVDGFVGTPAYMSPEQADRRDDVIDTRSDIYSLGVVLYELLTGRTPLFAKDVGSMGVDEIRRQIREVEPLRPSSCIGRLERDVQGEVAERRSVSSAKLLALVTGDLDGIVLKCLEKQPARRYESASALAEDLRRHLNHEPVSARAAGQWYVWEKFVRRHRLAFGIASAIALMLVAAVTLSTLLLFREKAALARAVAAEHEQARAREEAEKAGQQASKEAARSARATEFMTSVFNSVKPAVARGRDPELLREVLDDAAARLESALKDEPEVEAELCDVIGEAFWHINEPGKAARLHRRALELHEKTLGPMHHKVAFTLIRLGLFEMYFGGRETEAEKNFRRATDIRVREFGPDAPRTLDGKFFLVESLTRQKRYTEATQLLEEVRAVQMRIFPSDDLRLLRTEFMLAGILQYDGALTAAERVHRRLIANYPADTKEQILTLFRSQPMEALSGVLFAQGRIDEAIEASRDALTAAAAQGDSWPRAEQLAHLLHLRGKCDEALTLTRITVENARQLVRRDPSRQFIWSLVEATRLLGGCLAHLGRLQEAEPWLREACSLSYPPSGPMSRHPALDLANVLREQGKAAEADTVLEAALLQASREHNGFVFQLLPAVYRSLRLTTEADRAKALIRDQLASEAAWVEQSGTAAAPYSLALLCAAADLEAFELIGPIVRARLSWWRQYRPTEAPVYAYGVLAAEVLLAEGRQDEAERALLVASEGLERTKLYWDFGIMWREGRLDGALARFYAACTRPEEPGRWRQLMGGGTFDPVWEVSLAGALVAAGRFREAGEILPGATTRARELLAQKPDHDRLAALVSKADALWKECQAKVASNPQTQAQPPAHEEK